MRTELTFHVVILVIYYARMRLAAPPSPDAFGVMMRKGSFNQSTEKDVPQPQEEVAIGFLTVKCAPISVSL